MPYSSAIALSGMNAEQTRLQASGHNLANLATSGFHRQQEVQVTAPSGGVGTLLARAPQGGPAMETDVVGLLQAKNAFLANLAVFRTGDRMLGSLIDTLS
jgi:flagellar hook protein FlgE